MVSNSDLLALPPPVRVRSKPGRRLVSKPRFQAPGNRKFGWVPPPGKENPPDVVVPAFVLGEVIVMGPAADLNAVIDRVNDKTGNEGPRLEAYDVLTGRETRAGTLETRRYRFAADRPGDVTDTVERIREQALADRVPVLPSPNFACTTENFHGEGSPYHGAGLNFHGEGSPATPAGVAPAKLYWDQWAFAPSSRGGIDVDRRGRRPERGARSRIVVLDASCFPDEGTYVFSGPDWIKPELEIRVWHPFTPTSLSYSDEAIGPDGKTEPVDQCDVSPHGLFVAGLAHGVAPAATLELIRVLDDHGHGEMANLIYVLHDLAGKSLTNTVLNLSLGFVWEGDPKHPIPPPGTWRELCQKFGIDVEADPWALFSSHEILKGLSDAEAAALWDALQYFALEAELQELVATKGPRVVIAAAAGNWSPPPGPPLDAQIPASMACEYPALLAVAASDCRSRPSFFSQIGTAGAPGGGDQDPSCVEPDPARGCWDSLDDWLISFYCVKRGSERVYTYGFWAGTSFAAPLVSGMAAVEFPGLGDAKPTADKVYGFCKPPAADPHHALGRGITRYA